MLCLHLQRKELTSLSEALLRLDMAGAVKDIRRSNFVCKVCIMLLGMRLVTWEVRSHKAKSGLTDSGYIKIYKKIMIIHEQKIR